MVTVNMHDAKTHLSALVARVLDGEEVTIARAGMPVVDLIPHRELVVVYGLGKEESEHDPAVFDGVDTEIEELFYGDRG